MYLVACGCGYLKRETHNYSVHTCTVLCNSMVAYGCGYLRETQYYCVHTHTYVYVQSRVTGSLWVWLLEEGNSLCAHTYIQSLVTGSLWGSCISHDCVHTYTYTLAGVCGGDR